MSRGAACGTYENGRHPLRCRPAVSPRSAYLVGVLDGIELTGATSMELPLEPMDALPLLAPYAVVVALGSSAGGLLPHAAAAATNPETTMSAVM